MSKSATVGAVSSPARPSALWAQPLWVSLAVFALVAVWVPMVARWHTALHHDMAEQFVWAHAWQLGYPKHPPLPTWLFMVALEMLPPRPATLYALSALCMGLTGVFTYLAARELVPVRLALCVAALWGLMQPFSWRAWIYNHNTVLVMTVALTVFGVARAWRRGGLAWWVVAGVGAGLALSTKLQAAVPLAGLLWALWRCGAWRDASAQRGMAVALLVAAVVCAPPLLWMATGHTNALAYATHQLGSGEAEGESVRLGQFVVSELRMMGPALIALLVWVLWARATSNTVASLPAGAEDAEGVGSKEQAAWVQGLLWIPLGIVVAMGLLGGAKMHAQWGVQTFQFVPLALAFWCRRALLSLPSARVLMTAVTLQAIALLITLSPASVKLHAPGAVQGYPSAELAQRVMADWARLASGCPLRYVIGPFFEGGQLSAYAPGFPAVLQDGDPALSPWIDTADVARQGAVVLAATATALPPDVIHADGMNLAPPSAVKGVGPVAWGIRPPRQCSPR